MIEAILKYNHKLKQTGWWSVLWCGWYACTLVWFCYVGFNGFWRHRPSITYCLNASHNGYRFKEQGSGFKQNLAPCPLQRGTKATAATNGKRVKDKGTRLKVQG
jgi:hypothetical protein